MVVRPSETRIQHLETVSGPGWGLIYIVLPGRALKINPLQLPVGVELSDWIPRIADMLIEVLELPARARQIAAGQTLSPLPQVC